MLLLLFVLLSSVGCDQATKLAATHHLKQKPAVSFASNFVRFQYAENRGAFLSLGAHLPAQWRFWFFTVMTGAMLFFLAFFLWRQFPRLSWNLSLAFALVLGGGIGNFLDRVLNPGCVVDFVSVGVGVVRTGIFNVADVLIMAGVALVGWEAFRLGTEKPEVVVDPMDNAFAVPWEE
jgi:signal peptidase II